MRTHSCRNILKMFWYKNDIVMLQLQKTNATKYLLAQLMVVLLVLALEFVMVVMWGLQWELELVLQRVLMKAFLQNVNNQILRTKYNICNNTSFRNTSKNQLFQ